MYNDQDYNTFDIKKKLNRVLRITMAYLSFGFIWYMIGPINYQSKGSDGFLLLVFYISLFFLAFYLGFKQRLIRTHQVNVRDYSKDKIIPFLNITIWINLFFTFLNALQYSYTRSLTALYSNFLTALTDPGKAYYSKILSMQEVSTSYSMLTYITVFLGPILFPTLVGSVFFFKELKLPQKIGTVATLILEVFRWVSVGTNKGLLDIAVLLFTTFFVKALRSGLFKTNNTAVREKRKGRKYIAISIIVIAIFGVVFGYFLTSRSDNYPAEAFSSFPHTLWPSFLKPAIYKISSYLCQGYRSMQLIISNLSWKWTYGVGNSTFLLSIFKRLSGVDLTPLTYQARIWDTGLVARGAFQTVFSYLANDVSFPGVIVVMFCSGYFFCSILKEAIYEGNLISLTLLFMFVLAILNASCLNYMLSFSNMCVGFWSLFFFRLITKRYHFVVRL